MLSLNEIQETIELAKKAFPLWLRCSNNKLTITDLNRLAKHCEIEQSITDAKCNCFYRLRYNF